jgi:hypothetical protein
MKVIVKIKRSGGSLRRLLAHVYKPIGRTAREVVALQPDGSRVAGVINGMDGGMTRVPKLDASALAWGLTGRGEYRHVIISADDCKNPDERRKQVRALLQLGREWVKRFVPAGCYLGVVHDDREHMHLHLVLRNESVSGAALGWVKATIRVMQSMAWVSPETKQEFGIESGRGAGRNSPEFSDAPYPLAASLDATKLAEMDMEQINENIRAGTIQVGRINKAGEITSVIYNGRRIRLRTIRGLAECGGMVHPQRTNDAHRQFQRRHKNLAGLRANPVSHIA